MSLKSVQEGVKENYGKMHGVKTNKNDYEIEVNNTQTKKLMLNTHYRRRSLKDL